MADFGFPISKKKSLWKSYIEDFWISINIFFWKSKIYHRSFSGENKCQKINQSNSFEETRTGGFIDTIYLLGRPTPNSLLRVHFSFIQVFGTLIDWVDDCVQEITCVFIDLQTFLPILPVGRAHYLEIVVHIGAPRLVIHPGISEY